MKGKRDVILTVLVVAMLALTVYREGFSLPQAPARVIIQPAPVPPPAAPTEAPPVPTAPAAVAAAPVAAAEKPLDPNLLYNSFNGRVRDGMRRHLKQVLRMRKGDGAELPAALEEIRREMRRLSARVEEVAGATMRLPQQKTSHPTVLLNVSAAQWRDDVRAAKAMRDKVERQLTQAEHDALKPCKTYADLEQGGVVRPPTVKRPREQFAFYPKSGCRLEVIQQPEMERCLLRKKVLILGDSTLQEVAESLRRLASLGSLSRIDKGVHSMDAFANWVEYSTSNGTVALRLFWVNTAEHPLPTRGLDVRGLHEALGEADMVFVNHGLHDSGQSCHTLQGYFDGVRSRLAELKLLMQPKAQLYWVETKTVVHLARLADLEVKKPPVFWLLSYLMNMPDRAAAYREAAAVAAQCQQVPVVSLRKAFDAVPTQTGDGLHFMEGAVFLATSIMSNIICNFPPLPVPPQCKAGSVEEETKRIAAYPPEVKHCIHHGSTDTLKRFVSATDKELDAMVAAESKTRGG